MSNIIDLPDFEDLAKLAETIREKNISKMLLENKIKYLEGRVMIEARSNPKYFENGKPPAITFVEKTYFFSGFDDELLPFREELAKVSSEVEHLKMVFQLEKDKIDVWRTQSANERGTTL